MTLSIGYPVQIKGTDFIGAISSQPTDDVYLVTIEQAYRADQLEPLTNVETSDALRIEAAHGDEVFRLVRSLQAWSNNRDNKMVRTKFIESLERLGLIKNVEEPADSAPAI